MSPDLHPPRGTNDRRWPAIIVWALSAVLVLPCLIAGASQVGMHLGDSAAWTSNLPSVSLIGSSLLWAVGIAVLSAVVAWPAAWVVARDGLRPWMLTPLIVPSYLVYHSFGLVRDPTSWLGGWIERSATAPPDGPGMYWLPVLVGRILAFVGLALWAWPAAAVVIGAGLRASDGELGDTLKVDGAGFLRRQWAYARRTRGSIARAVGLVALIMLGSGVPLHLANAPTIAVTAWQEVVLHPGAPGVWLTALPLLVIAGGGGWVLSGAVLRAETAVPARGSASLASVWTTRGLVVCSTLLPLGLYVLFLRTWHSIPAFLRVSGEAAATSAGTAALVGCVGLLACGAFWWSGAVRCRAGAARAALCVLVFASLAPGILVGHAWAAFWSLVHAPDTLLDSPVPTVLAHATRFAGIAALAGCALAANEPAATRDARAIDAGASLTAWVRTGLSWGMLAGVAFGVACLSLHEIESSIVVQPPGLLSLPQTMLANLHFARQEETSAGAIVVIGSSLAAACAVGACGRRREA